ncbi:MAG: ribosome small subunit-dependent GTPase A [Flavobacteriales bacterium]
MKALVLKSTGSHYHLLLDNGKHAEGRIKGKVRLQGLTTTNPVAVGDKVAVEETSDGWMAITGLEPRRNYIVRKSINLSKQLHVVAANVDQAFLLITLKNPYTPPGFIDRFLLTAEAYHIPVTLLFNKTDVYEEKDLKKLNEFIAIYERIGYRCIRFNSLGGDASEIKKLLKDKTTLISGHSGVGKSTFINMLQPGLDLKVAALSDYHEKGQHTTTFAEMFTLDVGGFIIDTPGIKGFGIVEVNKNELSHYFLEMRKLLPQCKFNNCLHMEEPNCAVKKAVEEGIIAPHRYKNYLDIYFDRETDEDEKYK